MTTPKPTTTTPPTELTALYDFLKSLIPEGHDSCHVDSSCAGGPEPCGEERGEGR